MSKRIMSLKVVKAALDSPKTPMALKRGLIKKYAKQLAGKVKNIGALQSTMVGEVYRGNPKEGFGLGDIVVLKAPYSRLLSHKYEIIKRVGKKCILKNLMTGDMHTIPIDLLIYFKLVK